MNGNEPLWTIIGGGTAFVQAVLQLLIAFNVPISNVQSGAIIGVATIILTWYARRKVTPVSTLPPGVAAQIADAKTAAKVGG